MSFIKIWICGRCDTTNMWGNRLCKQCGKDWAGEASEPAHWICPECRTINPCTANNCSVCNKRFIG